jgi:AbiV family abortive infection protein
MKRAPQFVAFVEVQNELIRSGPCLLTGQSLDDDYEQFLNMVEHVEELWNSACVLFRSKCYPQPLFLAVSTLEETGKIGVARFQRALRQVGRQAGNQEIPVKAGRRPNPFFSHRSKHLLVAGAGAIVNNRAPAPSSDYGNQRCMSM